MPITRELLHQIFQSRVVHHQHAAGPGIRAKVDGDNRPQAIAAHQHLLTFVQNLFLGTRSRMRRHRGLQHAQARAFFLALDQEERP
ncbi:hypothetical protein D3C85_1822030 [compost metagenome]